MKILLILAALFTTSPIVGERVLYTPEVYADYTGMFARTAGQFWNESNTAAQGQWTWDPQSPTESLVSWGDPANWPPDYQERFTQDGQWVYLNGWYGNGTYYALDVRQWIADADCVTNRTALPSGPQIYAKWTVPAVGSSYCLFAQGTITEQSSGKIVYYAHSQTWTNVGDVYNPLTGVDAPCIRQTEQYWDDNGSPYRLKTFRDVYIAKGYGMAWKIQNYSLANGSPTDRTYAKFNWVW